MFGKIGTTGRKRSREKGPYMDRNIGIPLCMYLLLASHEMSPEKIAYKKLEVLSYGRNISTQGGIDRNYFSLKKSTAQCKTLCVSTNVMPILVPATFDMQFSQGLSCDLLTVCVFCPILF
jgi:hypothetical protein